MVFYHSASNLPELTLIDNFNTARCFTSLKNDRITLSKRDELYLFEHISSSDLNNLINTKILSPLKKEYMYYHHRLKYLSPKYIIHLIHLGVLPSRLQSVKPPPCLACLLDKSKHKP